VAATLITLREVVVRYGATTALDIDSLEVGTGEVLAIIGANGAGKSTLLRVMGLLQTPDRGCVEFPGLAVCRSRLALRRHIATVFQDPLLIDDSVYTNVALGLRLRGVARAELSNRVAPWLERFGIGDLAQRPARTLSGGEAQRVSLARAFVLDPDLLLLDEPFAALDPATREILLRDFHRIVKGLGVSVILVTHDRHEAFALAQRVAVLDRGRVAQLGSRDEVFHRPANNLVAGIVGFENRLNGLVEFADEKTSRVRVGDERIAIAGRYAVGSEVVLCIRAADVMITESVAQQHSRLQLAGRIREVFCAQSGSQIIVDCAGFCLTGSAHASRWQSFEPGQGSAVTAELEPGAIHVISAVDSL
jgi:tungstate transport system ATP-binding protein